MNNAEEGSQASDVFGSFNEFSKFEHQLIDRKTTWALTTQGILFAAYGLTFSNGQLVKAEEAKYFREVVADCWASCRLSDSCWHHRPHLVLSVCRGRSIELTSKSIKVCRLRNTDDLNWGLLAVLPPLSQSFRTLLFQSSLYGRGGSFGGDVTTTNHSAIGDQQMRRRFRLTAVNTTCWMTRDAPGAAIDLLVRAYARYRFNIGLVRRWRAERSEPVFSAHTYPRVSLAV